MVGLKQAGVRLAAAGLAAVLLASGCESGREELKPVQTMNPGGEGGSGDSGGDSAGGGVSNGNSGGANPAYSEEPKHPDDGDGTSLSSGKGAENVSWTVLPCEEGVQPRGVSAAKLPAVFERKALPQGRPITGIKAISVRRMVDMAGYGHRFGASYALTSEGELYAWGERDWKSVNGEEAFPVRIGGVPKLQAVDGEFALDETGRVWYLGAGQTPRPIQGLDGVRTIRQSGMEQLAVLKEDGSVWSWQRVYVFEENKGERYDEKLTRIEEAGARGVFAGMQRIYVLKKNGALTVHPIEGGRLPDGIKDVSLPGGVEILRAEGATDYSSLFVQGAGGEWFRYDENDGSLAKLEGLENAVKVTGGEGFALALMRDGTVRGWGSKRHMLTPEENGKVRFFDDAPQVQMPDVGSYSFNKTVIIAGLTDVADIQAGSDHALTLRKDGTVLSWGSNSNGQLGRMAHKASRLTEVGTLKDATLLSLNWDGMIVARKGDAYRIDADGHSIPWVIGKQIVKATYSVDGPLLLTKSGTLVQTQYRGAGCSIIKPSVAIRDINEDIGRATVVKLEDGSIVKLALNGKDVMTQELRLEGTPSGKPARLFGYPFPIVITDDGAVYAASSLSDTEKLLKRIQGLPKVKEWGSRAPAYYDFTGVFGYALADNGVVYEVSAKFKDGVQGDVKTPYTFEVQPVQSDIASLYGALTVNRNGKLFEQWNRYRFEESAAAVSGIRSMRSTYNFYIEGPGTMAHAAETSDGRVLWLGDMPFQRLAEPPAPVAFAP
jgi:alpha-tubulin suppressor-like RCC1 family protein